MKKLQHWFFTFFVRNHVRIYRWTGGRIGGEVGGFPVLILTTTGRKSGLQRSAPVAYDYDNDVPFIMASFAGSPKHPAWYLNLKTHPKVEVQIGGDRFRATA